MFRYPFYQYGEENGQVPAHMNFGKLVFDRMCRNKDTLALMNSSTKEKMTYGEFAQLSANIAVSLTRMGVRKGDVIGIASEKRHEFLPTVIGILCAGATVLPIDLAQGIHSLTFRIKIARPKIVFASPTIYSSHGQMFDDCDINKRILYGNEQEIGKILIKNEEIPLFKDLIKDNVNLEEFIPVDIDGWNDIFCIFFSSGTTGMPKGVPLTHLSICLNSQCIVEDTFERARILSTREWHYTYGLMYAISCVRACATIIYNNSSLHRDILETVHDHQIEVLQATPLIITEIAKSDILDDYDVTSVKYIVSSSTYVTDDVVTAIKKRLPNLKAIQQLYGMSEAGAICYLPQTLTNFPLNSCGVPAHGFVIKVVDLDTREAVGINKRGEICIKGPSVTKGYLGNVSPDVKDEEGFLKTGDVGYYDERGFFYIVNRIKELIKYNDHSIAPAEFEDILLKHPSVKEAGVVGIPHPTCGQLPVGFVVASDVTETELQQYIDSKTTQQRCLAGGIRFIDKLPRIAGVKLDREALKRIYSEEN